MKQKRRSVLLADRASFPSSPVISTGALNAPATAHDLSFPFPLEGTVGQRLL